MLKVTIPFESIASNLTLLTTADLNGPAEDKLRYGGPCAPTWRSAGRVSSLMATFTQHRRPRYGLDWSMGVGPLDLNAELALVRDTDVSLWDRTAVGFTERDFGGPKLLASGGVSTQFRIADLYRCTVRSRASTTRSATTTGTTSRGCTPRATTGASSSAATTPWASSPCPPHCRPHVSLTTWPT